MIDTLAKIVGIQKIILEIDSRAKHCLIMICGLWMLMTLCTSFSAFMSLTYFLQLYPTWSVFPVVFSISIAVIPILYIIYRRIICLALFCSKGYALRIIGYEFIVCLIYICLWLPNMMHNFVGDFTKDFTIYDIILLNRSGFLFMIVCLCLILGMNLISTFALSVSCRSQRRMSKYVYNI